MKKIILFSIIVLLVILGVGFYFLKDKLPSGGSSPPKIIKGKYNFDYEDGQSPWATHIKTEINTTFEKALNENQYLQTKKCSGDNTDLGKNPFGLSKPICLQGNGAKMIVPTSGYKTSYYIFNSPTKGGLFEEEYFVNGQVPYNFFKKYSIPTSFFVIPFNGYEVPTYYPIESKKYLPIWKQAFQKYNGITDEYFNKHIFVIGTSVSYNKRIIDGKEEKRFSVTYYYSVDWAHIKLTDSFPYSLEGIFDGITLEELQQELQRHLNAPIFQNKYQQIFYFHKVKPISSIATKKQVKRAVRNASSLLGFDINKDIFLDLDGQLAIRLFGKVDFAENKCLSGTIILENAQVLEIRDVPCVIIN